MKLWRKTLPLLTLAALFLAACSASHPESTPEPTPSSEAADAWQGESQLNFTAQTDDGSEFTLSDQVGKVVLVNFWATWCAPCVGELPDLDKLYNEYREDDRVKIIAVNVGEDPEVVREFLAQQGIGLPTAYDPDNTISTAYAIDSIPRTIIFNKDGTISEDLLGSRDYQTFKSALDRALEG